MKLREDFFNNEAEETFEVSNTEAATNLTNREKVALILDPRANCNSQALSGAPEWCDCNEELKLHCRAYHVETKAFSRQINNNDKNTPSPDSMGADESGESE